MKRCLKVKNCALALPGNNSSCSKTAAITNSIHLVSNWLSVVAASNEIGAQRVRKNFFAHRKRCRAKRLGNNVPAVKPAPRILEAFANVSVGTICLECKKLLQVHY